QEDIIVGSAAAGRKHPDLESIVGIFIDTLALRNYPSIEKPFSQFLGEVKRNFLQALENQDYQYEELVEKVVDTPDLSRNSLFDVMLMVQNQNEAMQAIKIPGLKLSPYKTRQVSSKFDMTFTAQEVRDRLDVTVTYSAALFKPRSIKQFINYFERIASRVLEDIHLSIGEVEILSPDEKQQLLYDFNDTGREFPQEKTVDRLFEEQAARTPDSIAVTGNEHEGFTASLSYGNLHRLSNQWAGVLREQGVTPGAVVGLMVVPSLFTITGILAVLKAGAAYLPIDPNYPEERVDYMLRDSGAKFLVVSSGERKSNDQLSIVNDRLLMKNNVAPSAVKPQSSTPAYVIYTSGTSGKSKGALIEHRNLVNYACWFRDTARLTLEDRSLLTSSFAFDLGYTSIYPSLLSGVQLHIVPRETYMSPEDLTTYIGRHRVSTIKVTPSLFGTIVDSPGFSTRNCRSLRLAILGGEEIILPDVKKVRRILPRLSVMNHYGPTEATIGCVAQWIDFDAFDDYVEHPTIGSPIYNMKVFILDRSSHLTPVGVPGELCVSGAGVVRGYLNRPLLTDSKFDHDLKDFQDYHDFKKETSASSAVKLYKTGDLARWLHSGRIQFLGRIDQQVKIRGFRIELGEIEDRLLRHEQVKEAVVLANQRDDGDKYLCAYVTADGKTNEPGTGELRDFLSTALPDYMIPSYFVYLDRIPLTPNGKIDRKALPVPGPGIKTGENKHYIAPRNPLEKKLAEIWAGVLNMEKEQVGIEDNFFHLGGHSLKATVLVSRIHKYLGAKVPLAEVFKHRTIRQQSVYLKAGVGRPTGYADIAPVEAKEYYPVSSAQNRVYVLQQMEEGGTGYNMPAVFRLQGLPDKDRLEETFRQLIRRHESLRTSFHMMDEELVQRVQDGRATGGERVKVAVEAFTRQLNLPVAPLLRAGLIQLDAQLYFLCVDMHHIISDGISRRLLTTDFMRLYHGHALEPLGLQYKDFSQWQNSRKESETAKQQETYWLNEFAGEIPVLELPVDFPRPPVQSFEGNTVDFRLAPGETDALRRLAREGDATLFMVLLALYNTFLFKITGQESMVVGTPVAGRRHADLEPVMGMFVNTLALKNNPGGEKTFLQFLREVKDRSLNAFENQDYQYEELVEAVQVNRDAGRNPLFDTMFLLQNMDTNELEIPGLELKLHPYENKTSKFDLTLMAVESGDHILFRFEFCTLLFKLESIQRFTGYFRNTVSPLLANPALELIEIDIVPEEEKARILQEFNDTGSDYPIEKTLYQLFEEELERRPDNIALMGPEPGLTLSYRELEQRVDQLAIHLAGNGVQPGNIVGIKVHRSLEMVIGIFGILKTGAAYLPIDPEYPEERIQFMLKDSGAKIIIGNGLMVKNLDGSSEPTNKQTKQPANIAYIIYTSGSTGTPKGVVVEHCSVVNTLTALSRAYPFTETDVYLLKTAYIFNVSVSELFGWLFGGGALAVLEAGGEKNPSVILDAIEANRVTHLNFIPSMFNDFVAAVDPTTRRQLSSLKYIFLTGEALLPHVVNKFRSLSSHVRLENLYGPTEAAIYASMYSLSEWGSGARIPIGKPLPNVRLLVLNAKGRLQPVGIAGELCIGGNGLARGYLNRPELTRAKFALRTSNFELFYHTGDLARWLSDGNIEFLGRIGQQVKIRGFRIELGEVEARLLEHPGIEQAVVIGHKDPGGNEFLCAYVVPDSKGVDIRQLKSDLGWSLPDYMVPSHLVELERLPLTPNGKIDRRLLPDPVLGAAEESTAPRDAVEEKMTQLWAEVLGLKSTASIGIDDNFFQSGGHSLSATTLTTKIHKTFNVKLELKEIFKTPFIRELARLVKEISESAGGGAECVAIEPAETKEHYPVSSAQKRLYALQQMRKSSTGYNMPRIFQLQGLPDKDKLEETFRRLIRRHESLRTSFHMTDEGPVQRVHDDAAFGIEYFLATDNHGPTRTNTEIIKGFVRPFDLTLSPLLRIGLMEVEEETFLLLVDMHHIISDGTSLGIMIHDFMSLYQGDELPPLGTRYKDFSAWQNSEQAGLLFKEQETWWIDEFQEEIPLLNLPLDFVRPPVRGFEGNAIDFELDAEETEALNRLARQENVTLFILLLALYNIFLSKITGQETLVVGTGVAGRRHIQPEPVIGMFVNTLALKNDPNGQKTARQFLLEVKDRSLKAFENQDYQYEELVERVQAGGDTGRNPLFDTVLALQNLDIEELEIPGLTLKPYPSKTTTSKFDLTLMAVESGPLLSFRLEYCTLLFMKESVEGFINYFRKTISSVLENPLVKISAIDIVPAEEKKRILVQFNNTASDYPKDKTIHELFEEQVASRSDCIAVSGESDSGALTYRELNRQSDRLAQVLMEKSVTNGSIVAIMMPRSIEMTVAILAILKAGGAYMPIDPDYPEERIDFMLKDSAAPVIITKDLMVKKLDGSNEPTNGQTNKPTNLAYIIYTSGSTGRAKGVMVEHRNVTRLVKNTNYVDLSHETRILQTGAPVFDATTFEIWGSLLNGGTLVLVENDIILDADKLGKTLAENHIDTMWLTAPLFNRLVRQNKAIFAPLSYLIVGGDVLSPPHINLVRSEHKHLKVINGYGPTENTTFSACYPVDGEFKESIPIGTPINNSTAYIVDKNYHLQPAGVFGELLVGGDGVSRGYLNNPELTAGRFVPNPFSSPVTGDRLYHTGDRCRWLPGGEIEFSGRQDKQVKIRGFRVEPGEIESLLLNRDDIKEAVVVDLEDTDGQ
ncbi:MAG: amino acid adenylation domain-containing protein, partial [bacterium]|nr:amino acid adenylation domain-containing protein [bacterium]